MRISVRASVKTYSPDDDNDGDVEVSTDFLDDRVIIKVLGNEVVVVAADLIEAIRRCSK